MCYNKALSDFVVHLLFGLLIRFGRKNSLIRERISAYISVSFLGGKYADLSSKTDNYSLLYGGVAVID